MSSEKVYRKKPVQGRSITTVDTILEAATLVLEKEGEPAITTTRVAELAGVSVGTLYQYFKNRDAILLGIFERQKNLIRKQMQGILRQQNVPPLQPAREFIRILVQSFATRRGAKRQFALLASMMAESPHAQPLLNEITEAALAHWEYYLPSIDESIAQQRRIDAFVMTRALLGVLQRAAIEEVPFIKSQAFEEALLQIVMTFSPLAKL
ncbi:TetR/AcrR family transcriptional regulator [Gallaecimonas mangrovi]|uniref:TetR/AcrR family transcriptional regulator n=1 Tax=Gallaecimonas mangrovi TaxID=2291597 RepID=UPI000E204077|nr:TetR/AcrR family transcriptional regulator [Gallaecimonas mangrovi]